MPPIKPYVQRYLFDHRNETCWLEDIATAVNFSVDQVRNCIYNMRATEPDMYQQIKVVVRAHAWTYVGPPRTASSNGGQFASAAPPTTQTTATAPAQQPDRESTVQPVQSAPAPTPAPAPAPASRPAVAQDPRTQPLDRSDATRIFEELGTNEAGEVFVIDETGKPYRLIPMTNGR